MRCPFCGHEDQKVLDSRPAREGDAIRRRRECLNCGRRFSTFEHPELPRLYAVKRDGTRMKFMPGSQYTQGHSPTGDPTDSQTAASVSSA